ncbi:MAG: hypothetical protein K5662_06210 [Lachnospiraceae bacterium]|nr:hypothetical protein [Lachnospiraceae bacterium]
MIRRMKESGKRIKTDNSGVSLVTVVIIIGFVVMLASTLLMTSLINYKMKAVNIESSDTFYSAERVLDEINVGLQAVVSNSLSSAYAEVLAHYGSYDNSRKVELMQTKYYERLWETLSTDPTQTSEEQAADAFTYGVRDNYSINRLYSMLKKSTKWTEADALNPNALEDGYGAILSTVDSSGNPSKRGVMESYDKNGVVLKDLTIYYKDAKGFVSVIKTDIRLTYPDFDFAANSIIPDLPKYTFIADGGTTIQGNTVELNGNMYADSLSIEATSPANHKTITNTSENSKFIVKNAINFKNTTYVSNEDSNYFWANTIVADSSEVTLNGFTNVANDLDIKGRASKVTISGDYNGFGNSLDDPDYSSAILINGTDSELNLENIRRFTVAGHAFINSNKRDTEEATNQAAENANTIAHNRGINDNSSKVYTGESLAIKSNQLIYLVPAECIGVSKANGKSMFNKNPLTAEEYNAIISDPEHFDEVSATVDVTKLGDNLSNYIYMAGSIPQAEKVVVPVADGSTPCLVYYYMKFADENAANKYFTKYYGMNKESMDQFLKFYVDNIKIKDTSNILRFKVAGNLTIGDKTDDYTNLPSVMEDASNDMEANYVKYNDQFTALCTMLIDNFSELRNCQPAYVHEDGKIVPKQVMFENMVDPDNLDNFISIAEGPNIDRHGNRVDVKDASGNIRVVITKGDYLINNPDINLVISAGDVTIDETSFHGTVVCNGELTVTSSCSTVVCDSDKVRSVLQLGFDKDGVTYSCAYVFRDGTEFAFTTLSSDGSNSDDTRMSNLIAYENWSKE